MDPEARAVMLKQNRYLDENGQPLSEDATVAAAPFKRLPVRMELEMDVREIPRLLTECANATLPVEVRQVRINASTIGGYGRGGGARMGGYRRGGGARMGGYRRGGGGFDEEGAGELMTPRRRTARPGGTATGQLVPNPAVVPVTIQGIIYIFNPPDRKALGLPAAEPPVADAATPPPTS